MKSSVFKERRKNLADLILNNELYVPMKTKEIAILLGIPKELRHELQEVLDSLVADGTIGVSKKGKYMKPDNVALVGTFESTSRGFGFVVVDGQDDDIFVKASDTKDAFYHDKVKVVITAQKNGDRRREGKIIEILDHGVKTLVGTYQKNKNFGFVVPDNQKIGCDIFVSKEHEIGAVTGSKVVVKISSYGSARKNPEGKIIEVIGHMDDPGTDILSIVKAYDLPEEFPDSVKKELKGIPDEVDGNDIAGRTDLRDVVMVTIDGEDSKDLDDAVSLTKENDIYHLGVHIADVSHYVKEGSPLDKEALKRGTSVYLVDRVIPMIPHQLSNGICSLNEGCDRLALSCLMDIDMKGNIIGHKICESVINVNRRMTYTSVKKILEDNDKEECAKYSELVDMFKLMQECADILRKKRFKRGSIDFDFPESKIILDMFISHKKTFALEYQGKVIGSVGIEKYNETHFPEFENKKCREIGYVLSKEYWGQGLMPEALKEVIRFLFENANLDVIFCGHFLWNEQSHRVQEKSGFKHYAFDTYETAFGTTEENEVTILKREDWVLQ